MIDGARASRPGYVVVHDGGRVISPMIVEGQVHGGAAARLR